MSKYRKLLKNSMVFAIGNLGSKLISFLLVPFYTYVLTRSQFGTVDLISTGVNMLLPIISLSIFDAVFRFTLDKKEDKNVILSNGITISIVGCLFALLFIPFFTFLNIPIPVYIYVLLVSSAFSSLLSNFSRAINQIKTFAFAGILGTIVTALGNILLLWYFKFGIQGYILSLILANISMILFLGYRIKVFDRFRIKYINKNILKRMIIYSLPLIPNAFSWWVNSSADRYFILAFVGTGANGLYAVANKIPSLLNILNQIFFQSWQMSAVEEYDSNDASKFYSETFNYYLTFQFIGAAALLIILKPLMQIIVAPSYFISWEYIPFLLLSVVYSSLSGFLGTTYTAAKRTSGIMVTTFIGAVINIIFGFCFVPLFGVQGASIAGLISFGTVLVIRLHDTKVFMPIKVNLLSTLTNHFFFILMIFSLFVIKNDWILEIVLLSLWVIMIISNSKIVNVLFKKIKK